MMTKEKIKSLIREMTVEEKAGFCAGRDFWNTRGLERLDIPSAMVTDGPHGLRKQTAAVDHLGLSGSEPAICFPAGCALASGFDPALAHRLGTELGKLAQAENVSTVLGPAMNIKRSPLCGRNFEYYSEDPLLSSTIATGTIQGVQSQNVGTSPKHFLANNQEHYRQTSNSVVDERTLREIYLASFEGAVKSAKPWTMMCSYNKINGTYASENKRFLTDILRGEWGFDGYVMTDWGACDDPVDSLKAGLDLEMPGPSAGNVEAIVAAVKAGTLSVEALDRAVERILTIVFRYTESHTSNAVYDFAAGHQAAREIAAECAVLLKNDDAVLPLAEKERVLVVGPYAKAPRYQGGGSSHVNAYTVTGAWDALHTNPNVTFVEGFCEAGADTALLEQAVQAAKQADKTVIFAGLPDSFETEGLDRKDLGLPQNQNELIAAIAAVQPNTIVVLHNGSPVSMPWISSVKAVLEVYLGGEAVGAATADLLYGKANPCGRLAETFPLRIEDTPCYPYYGVERDDVMYREGILVGYRYYETLCRPVLFPFGHGLSYTSFAYSALALDQTAMQDTDTVTASVTVTNTGAFPGKEVVQLYVSGSADGVVRPVRELRAFEKVSLQPGESKVVSFRLEKRAFAYWNSAIDDWYVPSGEYHVEIGRSAADIVLRAALAITCTAPVKPVFTLNSPMGDIMSHPVGKAILEQAMAPMMQRMDTLDEGAETVLSVEAMTASAVAMPLRAIVTFSEDARIEQMQQLIDTINQAISNS